MDKWPRGEQAAAEGAEEGRRTRGAGERGAHAHVGRSRATTATTTTFQAFEMALVDAHSAWHIACPLLPFSRPPVGTGDLTSAVFLARLLLGDEPRRALEHTASAYHAVMQVGRWEWRAWYFAAEGGGRVVVGGHVRDEGGGGKRLRGADTGLLHR